jgi:phosphopantothenoylcysteine synthetase/decarboxylase
MTGQPVVYVVACAAPPAREVAKLIGLVHARGWTACVLITPSARRFVDVPELERLTGYPVRSDYKEPGTPDVLPDPDAIIVAPATVNTVNKWGAGICDTLVLGLLVEGIGKGLPIVALPFSNRAHVAHPAFGENVAKLRSWGVTMLCGPEVYEFHEPGTGSNYLHLYPWELAVEAVGSRLA